MSTSNAGNLQGSEGILFASVYFCITKTFSCCGGLQQSPCFEILTIQATIEKENWREISLLQVCQAKPQTHKCQMWPPLTTHAALLQLEQDILPGRKSPPHPWWDFTWYAEGSGVIRKPHHFLHNSSCPSCTSRSCCLAAEAAHVLQGAGGCWAAVSALPRQQDLQDEQASGYNKEIIAPLVYGPALALCQERIFLSYVQDHWLDCFQKLPR